MTSRRLLAAGTAGSALIAVGGTGVGALPPSGWGLLRGATALALGLSALGLVLLGAAWWASRSRGRRHQSAAALLWGAPLLAAPPLLSRDLYAYAGQAALVAAGRDPYAVGPGALPGPLTEGVDEVWLEAPAPYGPAWLALAGLVVRATGDALVPALLGLRLLAVLGVALTAWGVVRLARDPGPALWLGVANPLLLLHFVGGGHNDALMVGLLTAGVATARTVRAPWALPAAAALVALAALVKVPALAALAYLPLTVPGRASRARAAVAVGVTALSTALLVGAASGLGWGWLGTLDAGRARLSLFSPLTGLGAAVGAPGPVHAAGLVAAALVSGGLLLAADRLGPVRALGVTLLVVPLLLPVVQPWYLLWGLPLLATVVSGRTAAALGAGCLVLCLTVLPSGRSVVRPPLYGLPTLGAVAVACVTAAPRALRRSRADAGHGRRNPPAVCETPPP